MTKTYINRKDASNKNNSSSSESYIISTYRVTEGAHKLVGSWLKGLNDATKHFFAHVLYFSVNSRIEQGEYVPVPAQTMKKEWGSAVVDIDELVDRGLIELNVIYVDDEGNNRYYSKAAKKCREFKVPDNVVEALLEQENKDLNQESCGTINLVTGRVMKVYARHHLKGIGGLAMTELVKEAVNKIDKCIVNAAAIEKHIENLRLKATAEGATTRDKKIRAIDNAAWNNIQKCNFIRLEDGLAYYEPGYKMQATGRVTEKGVGMQNCTRQMKDAAFSGIDNLYNYDLKSSQVWGLIQWFEDKEANLDTSWLKTYLENDKQAYADRVGISEDCWKKCFMALIMGGICVLSSETIDALNSPAPKEGKKEDSMPKILEYLWEESKGDTERLNQLSDNFTEVTKELDVQLKKWRKWLIEVHSKRPGVKKFGRGGYYLVNTCGVTFKLSDWETKDGWKDKALLGRKLAAFWLQGTEAAFIHYLTLISEDYGYEVINNQHDGLVTLGQIPQEAVDYAIERSELKYAKLELKSFL